MEEISARVSNNISQITHCMLDTMKILLHSLPLLSCHEFRERTITQSFRALLSRAEPGHPLEEQGRGESLKLSYCQLSMAHRAASAGATAASSKTIAGCCCWNSHRDPGRCWCCFLRYLTRCLLRVSRSGSRGSFWWSWGTFGL